MLQMANCNCGSGREYEGCCQPIHQDLKKAETAEQLMRARYCAFTLLLIDFLYDSFHPDTRRFQQKKAIEAWARENKWMQLEVIAHSKNTVEFRAHFLNAALDPEVHHEKSNFKQQHGIWYYLDGLLLS